MRHALFLWFAMPERRFLAYSRMMRPWRVRRFAAFGEGALLVRPRVLKGAHKMALGKRSMVYPDCSLSVEQEAWEHEGPRLTLADLVVLQSNVTITCAERIELAEGAAIGSNTLIADNDHTVDGATVSILMTPVVSEPMRIGRGTWVGNNCAIVRGAQIGDFCVIGANSVVRDEIPPYSIAVGAPARVVGQVKRPNAGSPGAAPRGG